MTNLMNVLKEQAVFGFTGKINFLLASNGQFQGVIYQHDGNIVGAQCAQFHGKKALYKMIFEDVETTQEFKFIVEPEIISSDCFSMKVSFDEVKNEAQVMYQKHLLAKKLKPALTLKLIVDPEIIVNHEELLPEEFDILSILTEWCTVCDIYQRSQLMEFEVTNALVGLRKKRAIKVFQN